MQEASDPETFSRRTDEFIALLVGQPVLMCTAYRPQAQLLEVVLHSSQLQGAGLDVLGVCTRAQDAEALLPATCGDVLVITCDLLEDGSCLPLVRRLRSRPQPPRLLVSLIVPHRATLEALLQAGVDAVVAQENYGRGCITQALQALRRGEKHVDPRCRELLEQSQRGRDELSARELEVLQLVANGLTNRAIAERLGIAEVTARDHVQRILQKLAVADRTAAAVEGIHRGYLA